MQLEKGDMWSVFGKTDIFMITTNPIRRKDGAVVMGRGIAKECKDYFPELPFDFGAILELCGNQYIDRIGEYNETPIWYFMVKDHWKDYASLEIIKESVKRLKIFLMEHPKLRVDLNFPGIGNGKLSKEQVLPLLQDLPDNVHVWERE